MLAAVVILAVMFVRRDRMDVRFLAKVALPLAVIALALLPFAHSAIAYLVAFLLKFAYVWFTFFVLLVLAGICYRYEVPSLRVFAVARASSEAAILLGIVLRRGFQGNGYMDSEAFAVAFAVAGIALVGACVLVWASEKSVNGDWGAAGVAPETNLHVAGPRERSWPAATAWPPTPGSRPGKPRSWPLSPRASPAVRSNASCSSPRTP